MPASYKIAIVEDLSEKISSAKAVYFTDYQGLSAPQATELRARLRAENIELTVAKKTLSILAAQKAGIDGIDEYLKGQTALAFTFDDPATPARILKAFSKDNENVPTITGLIFEGQLLPAEQAGVLAALPPKEILLGQLMSTLQQPMLRLTSTLVGAITHLMQVLTSIKEQKT